MKATKKLIRGGYNLSKILTKKHEGKWVALSSDYKKVVSFSADLLELEKKVGSKDVIYMKPLRADTTYSF